MRYHSTKENSRRNGKSILYEYNMVQEVNKGVRKVVHVQRSSKHRKVKCMRQPAQNEKHQKTKSTRVNYLEEQKTGVGKGSNLRPENLEKKYLFESRPPSRSSPQKILETSLQC